MDVLAELAELEENDSFVRRHIGPSEVELAAMLHAVGAATLDDVAGKTVPNSIRSNQALNLPPPIDEAATIAELRALAAQNATVKSLIGMGYHGTVTPPVVLRNVLENPGWYTAYTPYQAEIAQGRLEALVNFQTMICELTGMEIANASLLDEATAAAEAMAMAHAQQDQIRCPGGRHRPASADTGGAANPSETAWNRVEAGGAGGSCRCWCVCAVVAISWHDWRVAGSVGGNCRRA
jgi:hypothetical protein